MKSISLSALILLFAISCAYELHYTKEQYESIQTNINNHEITFAGGDGSSTEKAISISGTKNDTENVIAEECYVTRKIGTKNKDWKLNTVNEMAGTFGKIELFEIYNLKSKEYEQFYFDKSDLIKDKSNKRNMAENIIVNNKLNNNELSFTGGDGLSIKNAVIIFGAKSDEEGVIAEQLYLACPIPVI